MTPSPHSAPEALAVLVPIDHLEAAGLAWLQGVQAVLAAAPYAHRLRVVYRSASAEALASAPARLHGLTLEPERAAEGIYGAINQAIAGTSALWFLILGQGDQLTRWPELPTGADLGVGSRLPGAPWLRFHLSEVCQQDVLYRTAWFQQLGLRFDSRLRANADHLLHLQAMAHRPRIRRIPRFSRYAGEGFSCQHPDRLYHASLPSLRRHHLGLAALISTLGLRALRQGLGRLQIHQTLARRSRIAVVIVSNRPEPLERCLRSLAEAITSSSGHRLGVCHLQVLGDDRRLAHQASNTNGGSWDLGRLQKAAAATGVPVEITLLSEIPGPPPEAKTIRSSLRNLAAAQANQVDPELTHYYFLDGDIETSQATLHALDRHLHQPWIALPAAYLPRNDGSQLHSWSRAKTFFNYYFRAGKLFTLNSARLLGILPFPQRLYAPTLDSCQLLISAQVFNYVGGFQPLVEGWGGEDLYLGYRLYELGIFPVFPPIPWRPSRHIWHPTLSKLEKKRINSKCVKKIISLVKQKRTYQ